jgi:hypothetical protein
MTTDSWGPTTWTLIHILAQRVYPNKNSINELFELITNIFSNLPCPICSEDSKKFLSKVKRDGIKTPKNLQDLFFVFHNMVNKKKGKSIVENDILEQYKYIFIAPVYKQFIQVYQTNGNMNLIQDNMQRTFIKQKLSNYIKKYLNLFISPFPKPTPLIEEKEKIVEEKEKVEELD